MGDLDPIYNTWFLEPTRDQGTNGISVGSAVFAGLTTVTNRQTDRQTDRSRYFVCNNRPHLRSTAVRPKHRPTEIQGLRKVHGRNVGT